MGMGGGGKQSTTETKEIRLPAWVEAASQENYERAKQVANRPYDYYKGPTVAALDPQFDKAYGQLNTLDDYYKYYGQGEKGLQGVLAWNPAAINASTVGVESLAGKDLRPYMDPFLNEVERNAIRNVREQGQEANVELAADAAKRGAFGGSRQAVQAGVQAGKTAQAAGDLSAKLRSEGFQQAQAAAVGDIQREYAAAVQRGDWAQAAQIASRQNEVQNQQNKIAASKGMADIADQYQAARMNEIAQRVGMGQIRQEQTQRVYDDKKGKWQDKRNYPLEQLNILLASLGMSPYGHTETSTSTSSGGGGGGGAGQAMGLMGGLMRMLPMFGSDRALKTNVEPIGMLGDLPMYAYDYKEDVKAAKKSGKPMGPKRVGPMAQDVEKLAPHLVRKVGGKRIIDLTSLAA